MALRLDNEGFSDALVILGAAGLVIPAFARFRISPVIGFILVGVAVAASLAWITAIQLTPAADRPYIDGSTDNNVFAMVFGYNGIGRFIPSAVPGAVGYHASGGGEHVTTTAASFTRSGAYRRALVCRRSNSQPRCAWNMPLARFVAPEP